MSNQQAASASTSGTNTGSSSASTSSSLVSFVLLANGARGAAAVGLIRQVLEAPNVHVFGEILDHANIKILETDSQTKVREFFVCWSF